jgi:hypothetical protein
MRFLTLSSKLEDARPDLLQPDTMNFLLANRPSLTLSPSPFKQRSLGFLLEFLLITSAIAICAGMGFGAAVRFNRPQAAGSTLLHSEQSFPPRQDWPVSNATSPQL